MTVDGVFISDKARAGTAILEACKQLTTPEGIKIGNYMSFPLYLSFDSFNRVHNMTIRGAISHKLELSIDVHGNISRLNKALDDMPQAGIWSNVRISSRRFISSWKMQRKS